MPKSLLALLTLLFPPVLQAQTTILPQEFNTPVTIRSLVQGEPLTLTVTPRLAGAIHSVRWKNQEFINSFDHGRQLQSASNFDFGTVFHGETFNPTEAGSRSDGAGSTSTSRLLHLTYSDSQLQTTNQMAFWLTPKQSSSGHPAKNKTNLSNHLLTKRVTLGFQHWENVIRHQVTFSTPIGEFHRYAQFEALTGYMPAEFNTFWGLDVSRKRLVPLTDGPGEQAFPVILAKNDRSMAMGVYSPQQPSKGYENAGYGRFRFPAAKVTKWNSVFRIRNAAGIPAADFSFDNYVVIGNLKNVQETIQELADYFTTQKR